MSLQKNFPPATATNICTVTDLYIKARQRFVRWNTYTIVGKMCLKEKKQSDEQSEVQDKPD